ncbi:transketolase C-terminal domain-containing protein, partial [Chromohalobacter sp. 296-RDG]|uniref:transketolase-like TK C-terminal-containing protein n=1 Tax=Chromohalobacter sp. 296-RDG TaxID=2994062 RepID=UPI0024692B2E
LTFMEYMHNAVRMAAIARRQVIFVYTHDSIGLGEDGPTHQPIEQLNALRITPNLATWRPCDATETSVAWLAALKRQDGPTALVFSRQGLPGQARDVAQLAAIERGGYVLKDCDAMPELILIATGSEVGLAMDAATQLNDQGRQVRVVSMPCASAFDAQDADYQETVLPPAVTRRLAIEASHPDYWRKYVGPRGSVIGMTGYGESGKAEDLFRHFGFTVENVIDTARALLD